MKKQAAKMEVAYFEAVDAYVAAGDNATPEMMAAETAA